MRLRHLVISSVAAFAAGLPAYAADGNVPTPATTPAADAGQGITIETQDKPLDTVLQWISRRAGVNVVCNEADQPRVTLRLVNVTWQEAIEQIAAKYDLVVEKRSDRVWELTRPPKVRMEFQDAKLTVVLEALARQANVNIVISGEVSADARLTMTLNGVPWREALDVIVKAAGYAWIEQQYHIIRIVTPDSVQKDLITKIYHLNYVQAPDLEKVLATSLSKDGKLVTDARTNNLIITDTPISHDKLITIINHLDSRTREVQIEMRFVEFSDGDAQKLGFDPLTVGFDVARIGQVGASFSPFTAAPTATLGLLRNSSNIPTSSGNASGAMTFEAISSLNSTEILQAPQILTLDNIPATIFIGREVHFAEETVTQENGTTVRSLKEAASSPVKDGITIKVTPTITTDGFVAIKLEASNEDAVLREFSNKTNADDPNGSKISLPEKNTTSLQTSIMVADGKTGVIGGLLKNRNFEDERKVPVLGNIPFFGWAFKKRVNTIDRRNLTIFITPRIVRLDDKSDFETRRDQMREQLSGVKPAAPAAPVKPLGE